RFQHFRRHYPTSMPIVAVAVQRTSSRRSAISSAPTASIVWTVLTSTTARGAAVLMTSPDQLVLLGTKGGPAIRPGGPSPTSILLDIGGRRIVIDCGLGVSRALVEAGMALGELDLILITHLHSDHVLELGPLIHTAWTTGLSHPVTVCGPDGTKALWQGFLASLSYEIATRIADEGRPDLEGLVTIREYGPGPVLDDGGLTVTALRVDHPPVT